MKRKERTKKNRIYVQDDVESRRPSLARQSVHSLVKRVSRSGYASRMARKDERIPLSKAASRRARARFYDIFDKLVEKYETVVKPRSTLLERYTKIDIMSQEELRHFVNDSIRLHKELNEAESKHPKPTTKIGSYRLRIWNTLEDPQSSSTALALSIIIMTLISVSVVSFVLETLPSLRGLPEWDTLEVVSVIAFTTEFVLRLLTTPDLNKFCTNVMNMIDLVAILPFYIEIMFPKPSNSDTSASVFRVVRLIRVFRVLKISKYLSWIGMFVKVFSATAMPLFMLCFVVFIAMVVFSSTLFFLERDGENAKMFVSIPDTFWWCLVTLTTVGYGDAVPATALGKLVAGFSSLCGILVLAIPISLVSQNFNTQYTLLEKIKQSTRKHLMMLRKALKMVKSHRVHLSVLDYPEDLEADVDMVLSAQNEVIDLLDVTFGEHVNFIKTAIGKKKCASRFRVGQIIEKIMDGSHS